jgi:hypothetical protein
MILHIPHSSTIIPEDIRKTFLLSDHELGLELLWMTAAFTDDLFSYDIAAAKRIIYPVSRLVQGT